MTDILAAIGNAQLAKLDAFQTRRRELVRIYFDALSEMNVFQLPVERQEVLSSWHLFVVRLNPNVLTIDRDTFISELNQRQVGCSVHYIPIHIHPYYRDKYGYQAEDFPVSFNSYTRCLSLPLNLTMTSEDLQYVIDAIADIVQIYRR